MDQTTRAIVINKFGTLMLANAELATENLELTRRGNDKDAAIAELRAEIEQLKNQSLAGMCGTGGGHSPELKLVATAIGGGNAPSREGIGGAGGIVGECGSGGGDGKPH